LAQRHLVDRRAPLHHVPGSIDVGAVVYQNGQHRNHCPTVDCDIAVQRQPLGLQLRFMRLGYGGDDIDLGRTAPNKQA